MSKKNKTILKEFCTPDGLYSSNLPGSYTNSVSWLSGAYPFVRCEGEIEYGEEGQTHYGMLDTIIANRCNTSVDYVDSVKRGYYTYIEANDSATVQSISCYYADKYKPCGVQVCILFKDNSTREFAAPLKREFLRIELTDCDVHQNIKSELINKIMHKQYDEEKDGWFYINVDEEVTPYYDINGEEVDKELLDNILYYTEGEGKNYLKDDSFDFGRIWPKFGENDETYISLWLNNRFDDEGWTNENGKYLTTGTFNVKAANNDSCDSDSHVPSSLSDIDKKTLGEVLDHFDCDYKNSFVCIGDTIMRYSELIKGNATIEVSQDDMERMKNIKHILPPKDKWEQTKDFRDFRGEVQGDKLAYKDAKGNRRNDKVPMPMAQYHNMIRQENKMKKNILKEFCTPDRLISNDIPGLYDSLYWGDGAYPFFCLDGEIQYGQEGSTHRKMFKEIIAKLCNTNFEVIQEMVYSNYEVDKDGEYAVKEIGYKNTSNDDGYGNNIIQISIVFQNGKIRQTETSNTIRRIYSVLENYSVHKSLLYDIANKIVDGDCNRVENKWNYIIVNEEVKPYFSVGDIEIDKETFDKVFDYVINGGEDEMKQSAYDFGRIWPMAGDDDETYISLWLNNRLFTTDQQIDGNYQESGSFDVSSANSYTGDIGQHVPSSLSTFDKKILGEVLTHFGCDYDNSYVCIGNTIVSYTDLIKGNKDIVLSDDDMAEMDDIKDMHLDPNKWQRTKNFRDFRAEVQGDKLAYKDAQGNRRDDKVPMSMAQYHNMIRQENKEKQSIVENFEDEKLIFQHGSTPHQELTNFQPKLKPLILYKQFKLRLDANGENITPGIVYPLYVNTEEEGFSGKNSKGLQIGKWYKSGEGECWLDTDNNRLYTKGKGYGTDGNTISKLAYRPGWHLTTTPWGNQRGGGKVTNGPKGTGNNYRFTRDSEVWAKLEICVDINATEKARSMSDTPADQCLGKLGDNEYYEYRTNSNATKDQTWYIVDKIRIIDILDDDTVDNINDKFYTDLSVSSGRKVNGDPTSYTTNSGDIPYWKMPRENGKRLSKDDIKNMGFNAVEPTKGNWKESKKTKNTLKEMIGADSEYVQQWKKYVEQELQALQEGDLDKAGEYATLGHQAYKDYTNDANMVQEMKSRTFGELSNIFENNLVSLFKNRSHIIKDYTNLLKEDKNLLSQYHFLEALRNYKDGTDAKAYINEALDLVSKNINYKTIKTSNAKVGNLLAEHRKRLESDIDEELVKLYESCDYVLSHRKKISNLNEMNKHLNIINDYITAHPKKVVEEGVNAQKLIEDYNKKFGEMLNEDEKSFVQEIMDAKKGSDNAKQKKLFEKFKGDCLGQINKMISESTDAEKEQLLAIKEQILNKEFCVETLVKDMAKLLEMRDVLMSE